MAAFNWQDNSQRSPTTRNQTQGGATAADLDWDYNQAQRPPKFDRPPGDTTRTPAGRKRAADL